MFLFESSVRNAVNRHFAVGLSKLWKLIIKQGMTGGFSLKELPRCLDCKALPLGVYVVIVNQKGFLPMDSRRR